MSLGMVSDAMAPRARGLGGQFGRRDARDPHGVAQAHLPERARLPGLGAQAREVGGRGDHRERAAGQPGRSASAWAAIDPEREPEHREARIELAGPDEPSITAWKSRCSDAPKA
jgi:hypothetical protein